MNKNDIDVDAEREALAIQRLNAGRVQLPKRICKVRSFYRVYTDRDWEQLVIRS